MINKRAMATVTLFLDQSSYAEISKLCTVKFQWLEHFWNHENVFETGVVRATELIIQRICNLFLN